MKVGIPKSFYYYYYGYLWEDFLNNLGVEVIKSLDTNKEIIELGNKYSSDEMCLSLKNYIGHVCYLQDKCDYILIPRIDNYGIDNQTCTNFLASYDIISNIIKTKILNYNICYSNGDTELKAFKKIGKELGFSSSEIKYAYDNAVINSNYKKERLIRKNIDNLRSRKRKILIVGHSYNIYDKLIGDPIIKFIKQMNMKVIYANLFHEEITNDLSRKLSSELYFKYNRDLIGSIPLVKDKIDGVIFLSSFPCGPDSLVNELVMRKIDIPSINIVVDDLDSTTGLETRLESFIDIINARYKHEQKS